MPSGYTAGPWRVYRHFAAPEADQYEVKGATRDDDVAEGVSLANARLIAAAPELLEALTELHAIVMGECPSLLNEDSGGNSVLALKIEEAIANAMGGPREGLSEPQQKDAAQ